MGIDILILLLSSLTVAAGRLGTKFENEKWDFDLLFIYVVNNNIEINMYMVALYWIFLPEIKSIKWIYGR